MDLKSKQNLAKKDLIMLGARIKDSRLKRQRIDEMLYNASGVGSMNYDKDSVQVTSSNSMETILAEVVDLQREFEKDLQRIYADVEAIDRISNLNNRLVIQLFYINGMTFGQIAAELNKSKSTISEWHKRGLTEYFDIKAQNIV